MTPDAVRWSRIKSVVADAHDLPPDARSAHVRRACAGDRAMERAALRLLRHDGDRRLAHTDPLALGTARRVTPELAPGARVDSFTVVRLLGMGASSRVYEAVEDETERRVALKVLIAARPTAEERWRFRHEIALLGRLQHPGIATVLQHGESRADDAAWSWFAMELVDPARDWTTFVRALDRPARLRSFLEVADAVAHGHRHGVLHRDLKPDNVLVGADGRPKIIDFGVGRSFAGSGRPAVTERGQFVGTLAYASPEQLVGDPARVDTRVDVYSLGVMLYEMLADALPITVPGRSLAAVVRAVCDAPPDDAPLRRAGVPHDLGRVVRKALAKERDERYPSVDAFADDVRRYLAGVPVTAGRTSPARRLVLFARRHARGLAVSVAAMAVVVGAAVWQRAANERVARTVAAHEAYGRGFRDVLQRMITLANPRVTGRRGATSRRILETAEAAIERRLATSPTATAEALSSVASAYQCLGDHDRALAQWERIDAITKRTPTLSADCGLRARIGLATALSNVGRNEEAIRVFSTTRPRATEAGYPAIAAECRYGLAVAYRRVRDLDRARVACDAATLASAALPNAPGLRAKCHQLSAYLHLDADDRRAAERALRRALEQLAQAPPEHAALAAKVRLHLGALVHDTDPAAAEAFYRAAMPFQLDGAPPDDPDCATVLSSLGNVLRMQDRAAEGERYLRRATEWLFEHGASSHPNGPRILGSFIGVLHELDRRAEAIPFLERGIRTFDGEARRHLSHALRLFQHDG